MTSKIQTYSRLPTMDPQKRALLIGINTYLVPQFALKGCINDIELMADILKKKFGFPEENIRFLKDEAATHDGILEALNALTEETQAGDIVTVMYAGHGSTMIDIIGNQASGKNSTLVPYDSGRPRFGVENRDILDDEINEWLQGLVEKTKFVTLIFDCCHSGTIMRDVFGEADRSIEDGKPGTIHQNPVTRSTDESTRGESGWKMPLGEGYVLIAGCRDEEKAGEYTQNDVTHGRMTYFLTRELQRTQSGTTYLDVFEKMTPKIVTLASNSSRPQHPQMEGQIDREVFGVRNIPSMDYVQVNKRNQDHTVRLAAGMAHGMVKDSEWTIYPEATKEILDSTPALGRVRIDKVFATEARATILEESVPNAIGPASRAFETVRPAVSSRMRVQLVAPADLPALRQSMADTLQRQFGNQLQLVELDEPADARIYLVKRGETLPGLATSVVAKQHTWTVVGVDGLQMMPRHTVDEDLAVSIVLENLVKIEQGRRLHQLIEDKKPGPLDGAVQMVLQQEVDGIWVDAPNQSYGAPVFQDGELIDIKLTNTYDEHVFIHLFLMGVDHSIVQLFPPAAHAKERLISNDPKYVFKDFYKNRPPIKIPESFPHDEGFDTLFLLVTKDQADFSGLIQAATRSTGEEEVLASRPGMDTPLGRLLSQNFRCIDMSDTTPVEVGNDPNAEWTAAKLSFLIRR